ncbi:MAG: phosphate acyltransferase [Anaerovoracaceae bacterium]
MLENFTELKKKIGSLTKKRVAIVAAQDVKTLQAVIKAKEEGFIEFVLLGDKKKIIKIGEEIGKQISPLDIINTETDEESAEKAVELVRQGKVDFIQKGLLQTATILKAVVNKEKGIATEKLLSHISILQIEGYHKLLAITDGGMVLDQTLANKKAMLENAVELFHRLGYKEPKVACMCALEKENPKMPETVQAAALKEMNINGEIKGCLVEGPISFDIAMEKEAGQVKGFDSPVCGETDIIVTPTLVAGNMTIKSLYTFGHGVMAGCVLGAKCPIALTSRDAEVEERYYSLLLCSGLCG